MKVGEVVMRAFMEVVSSKTQIENVDYTDGLRYLNRMMAKLEATGVDVGYTQAATIDDELTVVDGAIIGMVKNLALSLWPQYNSDRANQLIKFSAKRGLDAMRAISFDVTEVAKFPPTLPRGSGNYLGGYQDDFYTQEEDITVYIGTEDGEQH